MVGITLAGKGTRVRDSEEWLAGKGLCIASLRGGFPGSLLSTLQAMEACREGVFNVVLASKPSPQAQIHAPIAVKLAGKHFFERHRQQSFPAKGTDRVSSRRGLPASVFGVQFLSHRLVRLGAVSFLFQLGSVCSDRRDPDGENLIIRRVRKTRI